MRFFQDPAAITNICAGACCWCYHPENKSHFLTSSCFVRKGTDQAKYQLPYSGIHKETAKSKFIFEIFEISTVLSCALIEVFAIEYSLSELIILELKDLV